MGITGNLWSWFRSFLSARRQTVSINNNLSQFLPVNSGVPQGSLLGPLLFFVFTNDLPLHVQSARILLYADDTKCYTTSNSISSLQSDLDSLHKWRLSNIIFNSSKTTHLRFGGPRNTIPCNLFLNDQRITQNEHQRDLGINISDHLSWSPHYTSLVSKGLIMLGLLRRTVGSSSSIKVRKFLYIILIRSQITYCSPVWQPHRIKGISLLESVQQKATKWILNDYVSDYKTRLCSLQMLPLMMVYEYHITFFLKSVKILAPLLTYYSLLHSHPHQHVHVVTN